MLSLSSNVEKVQELLNSHKNKITLNSHKNKMTEKNDALKVMVMALKEETVVMMKALSTRTKELEGVFALCRAAVGNGVTIAALNCKVDVLKPKEFAETRSTCDEDNIL
ncbi:hypothetical protein PVK06_020322 [Gossypium arboreum]|uniref:Uncharacterized protein n=1 Tax=Gossypium arboreum TaxID=29729 RepID=A0ABR0PM27_GOSAR|nr:hypothetical protein PVK06_020322 [Gossypium arboreum]